MELGIEMTDSRFRLLMIVSLGLMILSAAADLLVIQGHLVADPAKAPSWGTAASVGEGLSFAWLVTFASGFIGMYFFKPWGRFLSLVVAIALPLLGVASAFAFGNTVDTMPSSAVASAAGALSLLTWGAVLALAYCSTLSLRFKSDGRSRRASSMARHESAHEPVRESATKAGAIAFATALVVSIVAAGATIMVARSWAPALTAFGTDLPAGASFALTASHWLIVLPAVTALGWGFSRRPGIGLAVGIALLSLTLAFASIIAMYVPLFKLSAVL